MNVRDVQLVVVTGAGSGIGRATALRFAAGGATVVCLDIDKPAAAETVALIAQDGGAGHAHKLDVADGVAYARLAAHIKRKYGVPDVVVNNAGIAVMGGTLAHTVHDWDRVLGVNLSGVVHGCRLFGAQMAERGAGGHLVNIASLGAFTPSVSGPSYCVSKAAVKMLSESLRAELASEGIGVSVICPGGIATNIYGSATFAGGTDKEAVESSSRVYRAVNVGERLGLTSPPDAVARTIVRAVGHNWAVVPIRPEAWATYALSRLSPGLLRRGIQLIDGASPATASERPMPSVRTTNGGRAEPLTRS